MNDLKLPMVINNNCNINAISKYDMRILNNTINMISKYDTIESKIKNIYEPLFILKYLLDNLIYFKEDDCNEQER